MSPRLTPRGRLGAALLALSALLTAGASPAAAQARKRRCASSSRRLRTGRPSVASVINVRVKNTGTTTYDGPLTVTIRAEEGSPALSSVLRSFYGWNCLNYPYDYWSGRSLRLVPATTTSASCGAGSSPAPTRCPSRSRRCRTTAISTRACRLTVRSRSLLRVVQIPPDEHSRAERQRGRRARQGHHVPHLGNSSSVTEHPRGPKTTAAASPASVSGSDVATIGLASPRRPTSRRDRSATRAAPRRRLWQRPCVG